MPATCMQPPVVPPAARSDSAGTLGGCHLRRARWAARGAPSGRSGPPVLVLHVGTVVLSSDSAGAYAVILLFILELQPDPGGNDLVPLDRPKVARSRDAPEIAL